MRIIREFLFTILSVATSFAAHASGAPIHVNVDNFVRAETHKSFGRIVALGGFGKLYHVRKLAPIEYQVVVRTNRDTLYSVGVFDLDASPVTISLPDSGGRYQAMQILNEDEYSAPAIYRAGSYTLTKSMVGTRYVFVIVRIFFNPLDAEDIKQANLLQDSIRWSQKDVGKFEIPLWDSVSQDHTRDALTKLGNNIPDSRFMFGTREHVDPVRHLIGAAIGWGANTEQDALYLMFNPSKNDGTTHFKLNVKDVPVNGFWSVSVYNAQGYFEKNPYDAYSINNLTALKNHDGSIDIQFGGCDGKIPNCLPIMKMWNYWVRLYLPRSEILDGNWSFPVPTPIN